MAKTFIFLLAGEGRRQLDVGVLIKNVWKAANQRNKLMTLKFVKRYPPSLCLFLHFERCKAWP